jgi:hypothetical protein
VIYFIDFRVSREYCLPYLRNYMQFGFDQSLVGTQRYAGIASMKGCKQSRRDDLESLGYSWVLLLNVWLPWQGLTGETNDPKLLNILKAKMGSVPDRLCGGLPAGFREYFERVLQFDEGSGE